MNGKSKTCSECRHRIAFSMYPPGITHFGRWCNNPKAIDHLDLGDTDKVVAEQNIAHGRLAFYLPTQTCRDLKAMCGIVGNWFERKEPD